MNPRQLEAFAKIVEHGSVTEAAVAMGITQSAASRLLQRLQEEIGFKTFTLRNGRLTLTEEGKAFYREVAHMYVNLRDIETAAARIRTVGTGSLRVCVMPGLQQGLIPQAIALFTQEYPGASVFLDVRNYLDVVHAVTSTQVELGFANLPVEEPRLESRVIYRSSAVCLIPAAHSLAKSNEPLDMSALDDVDFIRIPRARYTAQLERLFKERSVQPRVRVEARTILVAAELAVQGVGVCVVDDISLVALNDPRIVVRRLLPHFAITIGAVYRADESVAFLARKFLDICDRISRCHRKSVSAALSAYVSP